MWDNWLRRGWSGSVCSAAVVAVVAVVREFDTENGAALRPVLGPNPALVGGYNLVAD